MLEWGVRTYCSEPNRGRQKWQDLRTEQAAVYANRRRIRGERGRRLLRQRGEKLERWNQHLYDRGRMRRGIGNGLLLLWRVTFTLVCRASTAKSLP
jgi:hypothetical protein